MKKILLCCSAGMSTSMLVKKMEQAAEIKGIECKIDAMSVNAFEEATQEYAVCLLGPQVRFQLAAPPKTAHEYGKNNAAISP
ncbi:PTS sugar transporter subunit IIB, partial [Vibrio cholerae]|uniref:PTS sugar transporter subunit IIB n=1 Tax=Vibrio cholerae TaxID=666 RepID=UPI00301E5FC6